MKKRHNTTASLGMSARNVLPIRGKKKALTEGFVAEKLTHTLVLRRTAR